MSPSAFYLKQLKSGAENYVSVYREKYCDIETQIMKLNPRELGDSLCGYASLSVSDVHAISFMDFSSNPSLMMTTKVKSHKQKKNRAHAGVHVYRGESEITADDNAKDPIPSYLLRVFKRLQKLSKINFLKNKVIPLPLKFEKKTVEKSLVSEKV